ncbi:MAG: GDP-fucose synthetase [Syntrophobacteraceae bacterium CG2_30_61_12]|nr:MAG: GDP-fucose synthetase [Syntrophobacteraceae bacterium CG2_30_61_12]
MTRQTMQKSSRIYIAGHKGLVGSALVRLLEAEGYKDLLTRGHAELDLESRHEVRQFLSREQPEYVFLAAAKVGGIHANNTYPVDFLLRNLKIQSNILEESHRSHVKGLLFLGSSCIYPKLAPQPIKEEYLLTGVLEPTNEPYAIAKIAGIELCEAFNRQYGTSYLSVMPTNLYGPNDSYDLEGSHVLPALIRKFHLGKLAARGDFDAILRDETTHGAIPDDFAAGLAGIAKVNGHELPGRFKSSTALSSSASVRLWGTGAPRRELLHSDDLASACIFLMERIDQVFERVPAALTDTNAPSLATRHLFNIGCGEDVTIRELAEMTARTVGFAGPIAWDPSKPDGTPRKLLDVARLSKMGWTPKISLAEGIRTAYEDYLSRA